MEKNSKIYIAGHTGLVGSALVRKFNAEGYNNLVYTPYPEYDLRNQQQTNDFFEREKPEYVIIAAAKVGGILANNTYRAEFIYDNIMIETNIIHAAYLNKVKKLIFLGSSCIYPKNCPQPMKEEYLLTGPLEQTNEPYAIAKIAGIKMCENYYRQYGCNFYSVMPTNLYGPNDNFDLETSHVLPAILRKMHLAKCLEQGDIYAIRKDLRNREFSVKEKYSPEWTNEDMLKQLKKFGISSDQNNISKVTLTLWGSGYPYREFLYVDDLADALIFLMKNYSYYGHVNVGSGKDITIKELAIAIKNTIDFRGTVQWDKSKPDGTPKKLLDVTKINTLGWVNHIPLDKGISKTYKYYIEINK